MDYGNYRFGRQVITIPVSKETLNEKKISKHLDYILKTHAQNIADYEHLHDVYTGKSKIWEKSRKYSESGDENIIINENHPFSMVEFKKGYMFGDDIKYSCTDNMNCTDDITYLNKYMKEQKKKKKNIDLAEDVYVAGSALRITLPKSNARLLDLTKNAPFEMYNLEYVNSFVVYSSNYKKEKLFGGIITALGTDLEESEIIIYSDRDIYCYKCTGSKYALTIPIFQWKKPHYLGLCPISEYKLNKSRIGIVEIVESILDGVNMISSSSVDNIVDFVNSILVVYNVEMNGDDYKLTKDNGLLILQTNNPNKPAEAKYLVNQLNHGDVMVKYEALLKVAYDIVGVPQASQNTTSGGDTGQARLLGAGWSRADIVGKQDEASLSEGDMENLEVILSICHKHPDCPINEVSVEDIEITFNRNRSDNLLVKTQSLQTLVGMNMPKETALGITGLVADNHEVAAAWDKLVEEKEAKERATLPQNVSTETL